MPATVKLSKSLKTHSGEVTELILRDLVASDLVKMQRSPSTLTSTQDVRPSAPGRPAKVDYRVETNFDVAMDYLVLLTGIDSIVLGTLPAADFRRACDVLIAIWNAELSDGSGEKNTPLDGKDDSTAS